MICFRRFYNFYCSFICISLSISRFSEQIFASYFVQELLQKENALFPKNSCKLFRSARGLHGAGCLPCRFFSQSLPLCEKSPTVEIISIAGQNTGELSTWPHGCGHVFVVLTLNDTYIITHHSIFCVLVLSPIQRCSFSSNTSSLTKKTKICILT